MSYKNLLIVITIFILTGMSVRAQRFTGGVAAGVVGSQVAGDTYSGFDKAGIYAGVWVNLPAEEHSAWQMELDYIQKGSRRNPDPKSPDPTYFIMRLGYVELAFLYQYRLASGLLLEGGPAFSFLLHHFEERDYQPTGDYPFRLFNTNATFGVGYKINDKMTVHFRTDNSIYSIRTHPSNGNVGRFFDTGQYNDALILSLSYTL
ncbi:MAG TPA: outer membrane beta-barrel protein [Bacteroidales bacterium]|nr:outer membrane beta-barrel protein [Bacteroidales bacterium]HPT03051.1 outer membrane beta-barrel protein [Bacteroidales bacterium]